MLCRMLTTFSMMMLYCSTSMSSRSSLPLRRTDTAQPVQLASSRPHRRTYLGRGLTGRVHCPVADDPPHRLVIWSVRGSVIQSSDDLGDSASRRRSVDLGGILVIEDVQPSDAGDYRCTLYSPQDDVERLLFVVRVIVRGE